MKNILKKHLIDIVINKAFKVNKLNNILPIIIDKYYFVSINTKLYFYQ